MIFERTRDVCKDKDCATYLPMLENNEVLKQPIPLADIEPMYAQKAVEFITQNRKNPFFLYMAFSHAHVAFGDIQWCSEQFNGSSVRGLYGDAVQEMDWVAGQILDTLRSLNLEKNTLVILHPIMGHGWKNSRMRAQLDYLQVVKELLGKGESECQRLLGGPELFQLSQ